jgi:hypothetical protein
VLADRQHSLLLVILNVGTPCILHSPPSPLYKFSQFLGQSLWGSFSILMHLISTEASFQKCTGTKTIITMQILCKWVEKTIPLRLSMGNTIMGRTIVLPVRYYLPLVASHRLIEMEIRLVVIYTCMVRAMVARLSWALVSPLLDNDFL